ncbi:transposon-encoded TnpW family protein [Faecalibacterium prausnitzii]|uniref:transposon-encoded TnpW family protein n=1 Tax=Faecalibacterium prausnitzii TaxID=853 RepID=UPI003D2AABC8
MQVADAVTASRAPENTPAMVKKIGKTTYKVHVHFSNTSTETMSDKIKRMDVLQVFREDVDRSLSRQSYVRYCNGGI